MKFIKIAGLCLVAMFAMSMATAGTALAAPRWLQCAEGPEGEPTKYSESQCLTASVGGKWQWTEIAGTEEAFGRGSLTLKDLGTPVGTVEVSCSGDAEGTVGPGKYATVLKISEIKCIAGKNCEKIVKNAEPVNLKWQTELAEVNGKLRGKITNGKLGSEAPGWAVSCEVLGIAQEDRCTSSEVSTSMENRATNTTKLLVRAQFEGESGKLTCKIGGAGEGEILGPVGIAKSNGRGLRVLP